MKTKNAFILGYFFGSFLFFLTSESEPNFNLTKIEKSDIVLLKNGIVPLNLTEMSESSVYEHDFVEVAIKRQARLDIKTKTKKGKNSIFVDGFQAIRMFPARPNFNLYDPVENQYVKPSVMLKAHITCMKQMYQLPREIDKKDKTIKFDDKYSGLFKKEDNYEKIFGYNLYSEENLGKDSSKNKIKQGKQKLFKKYGERSKEYLRENLFENPSVIKSDKCRYLDTDEVVKIYYDELTDLFAIVDLNKNCLLDFGIATEFKYAEIFAYKSSGSVKKKNIFSRTDMLIEEVKSGKSKELEIYQEQYVLSRDDAHDILTRRYGSNFLAIENNEFQIQEWQALKKLVHAVCFGIKPEDFGFSQEQAKQLNATGGPVAYVRKGNKLPNLDLIRAYQNAIKNFCEDRNQSVRNNESTFRGEPSITFYNPERRRAVVFDRETKIFRTAYTLSDPQHIRYLRTNEIGE